MRKNGMVGFATQASFLQDFIDAFFLSEDTFRKTWNCQHWQNQSPQLQASMLYSWGWKTSSALISQCQKVW
jgi:hypothetical protein